MKFAEFREQQRSSVRFAFRYGHKLIQANEGEGCIFCGKATNYWLETFMVTAEVCLDCEAIERPKAEKLQAELLQVKR